MNFALSSLPSSSPPALIVSAYLVNSKRPRLIVEQPSAAFIRASGKCAECHRNLQYSIVHEFEMSKHAAKGVTCLDMPSGGAETSGNESLHFCHQREVDGGQLPVLSRNHLSAVPPQPARGGIVGGGRGRHGFLRRNKSLCRTISQPGGVKRPAHPLTRLEGGAAPKAAVTVATVSANQTKTAPSAIARPPHAAHVVGGTRAPASTCGQSISARTIRNWKFTPNRSTA